MRIRSAQRALSLLLAAVVGSTVLAACSSSSGSSSGDSTSSGQAITLTFWDHVQSSKEVDATYQSVAKEFEASHPGVTINIQTFPFDTYQQKLLTAVKGGQGPDIMSLDQPWVPQFAESGVIQPLDKFISASSTVKQDSFFPAAWDSTQWKSKQWAVPLGFDVWEQLLWNPDLFKAAGLDPTKPPKTWDELLAAAKALTKNGGYGIVLPSAKPGIITVFNNSFIYSNGGAIIDDSGKVVIDSPQNLKTYTYLYKNLIQYAPKGMTNMDQGAAEALFTSGKVAMMFDGNWSQETMAAQAKFKWQAEVPPVPNEGDTFHGATGGWNLAVNAKTKDAQMAFDFIQFLTTTVKTQVAVAANTPAYKPAATVYLAKRQFPEVLTAMSATGMPRPKTAVYPQVSEIQESGVQRMIQGDDIATVVQDMQSQIEKAIAE